MKKKWDRIAQSFFECFDKALVGLKREGYITLEDYEHLQTIFSDMIKET